MSRFKKGMTRLAIVTILVSMVGFMGHGTDEVSSERGVYPDSPSSEILL